MLDTPDKDLAAHLNAIYRKHRYGDIELYPDVIPTFDALAPHFKLGLLSKRQHLPRKLWTRRTFLPLLSSL